MKEQFLNQVENVLAKTKNWHLFEQFQFLSQCCQMSPAAKR